MRLVEREGAAYVEFLVVVMPFLILFLGLTQLALLYGAQLMVEHSAARAARAAIVVLPDDHEEADYAGVPVNQLVAAGEGLAAYATAPSGGRLEAITTAARITLAPISPALDSLSADSVAGAISGGGGTSLVAGLLGWTKLGAAVTFPDGEGGYRTSFGPREMVTTRVTFLFKCSVPLARSLMCKPFAFLPLERVKELAVAGGILGSASTLAGWRVVALQAERTLPNQGR